MEIKNLARKLGTLGSFVFMSKMTKESNLLGQFGLGDIEKDLNIELLEELLKELGNGEVPSMLNEKIKALEVIDFINQETLKRAIPDKYENDLHHKAAFTEESNILVELIEELKAYVQ